MIALKKWLAIMFIGAAFGAAPIIPASNGLISVAVFHDAQGNVVYRQMADDQYKYMGQKDGGIFNPAEPDLTYDYSFQYPASSTPSISGTSTDATLSPAYTFTDDDSISLFQLLTPQAHAAIAFGATTTVAANGTASATFSSPNVSGSNTIGIVNIFAQTNFTGFTATWNGATCTSIDGISGGGTNERVESFYCIAPTAGVTNVVISRTGSSNDFRGYAAYYTGAAQTGQPDAHTTSEQTTATFSKALTTVADQSWELMFVRGASGLAYAASGGATILRANPNTALALVDSNAGLSAGSNTITVTSTSQQGDAVVFSIAPFAAANNNNDEGDWWSNLP